MDSLIEYIPVLAGTSAVGSGIMAGLFFTFSNFVMKALAQMPAPAGMEAMRRINVTIINPLFFLVFFGTALSCLAVTALAVPVRDQTGMVCLAAGALCYLFGVIGITMAFNVPLNNMLAAAQLSSAAETWPRYVARWQAWNHVRTGLAVIATALLVVGLSRSG